MRLNVYKRGGKYTHFGARRRIPENMSKVGKNKIPNKFDSHYTKNKFAVLNAQRQNISSSKEKSLYETQIKRKEAILKDFQQLNKNNIFQDFRQSKSKSSHSINIGNPYILTQKEKVLDGSNINGNEALTFANNQFEYFTQDHFAEDFTENIQKISHSTKALKGKAPLAIVARKDEETKLKAIFEELENKWTTVKQNIFKNKIPYSSSKEANPDQYSALVSEFTDSAVTYAKRHDAPRLENKARVNIDLAHDSADRLASKETKMGDIEKPDFFIPPSEYESKKIEEGNITDLLPIDEVIKYLKNDWGSFLVKSAKNVKYVNLFAAKLQRHFDNLISYLITCSINTELANSAFENIKFFYKSNVDYMEKRMRNCLKLFLLDAKSYHKIPQQNILLILLIISKISQTNLCMRDIFEVAFQLSVYLLHKNLNAAKTGLVLCEIIFEFCCNNNRYVPEVIKWFRLVLGQDL
ncbi:hypothetical protein HZS_4642 [Henneguya salminicola]|nr:hypothetical protein HZS_4642 [Henneguya salminicola]